MLFEHSQAVIEKYRFNQKAGKKQYEEGNVTPFTGYGPTHEDGIALRSFYGPGTVDRINCQIVEIDSAAKRSRVDLYKADKLWKIHSTISNLIYIPNTTPGSRQDSHHRVLNHSLANRAMDAISGCVEFQFDYLFWGNAITIASTNIPDEVIEARRHMSQIAKELEMSEQDNNNILHITVARIAGLGQNPSLEDLNKDLQGLHSSIQNRNLRATLNGSSIMPNGDFLNTGEADLVKCIKTIRR